MNRQKLNRLNKLAEKIGNGNQEETNQAFEEMMGIYKNEFRLIISFWAQRKNYSLDRDDLIQIASLTLFQTAIKWNNSNRGRDFACYVNPAIRAALIRATSEDAPIRVPYGSQQNKRAKRQKRKGQDKILVDSTERIKVQNESWVEGTTRSPMEIVLEREQNKENHHQDILPVLHGERIGIHILGKSQRRSKLGELRRLQTYRPHDQPRPRSLRIRGYKDSDHK